MAQERVYFDTSEVATGRTALEITDWIDADGADWGEAGIEAFLADKDRGSVPVDFRVPNRTVHIPLTLRAVGGTTGLTARANIQAKVALFQREGGFLKRLTASGGTVYADIVDASFKASSVAGWASRADADPEAELTLTCLPDFYEAERTLGDHTETTNAELNFTETSLVGDYPARVRVVFDNDQASDQRGLIWSFRNRYYDSASTAALKFEAESLGTLDTAAKAALSGASGGTVVTHGTLSTNWTPVLSTNVAGTQYLTHKGTYRLCARVYSTSGTTVQARAVWDVGDLVNPTENDSWRLPGASNFYFHDFGEVRLDPPPVGTYRWAGQIQAKGDVGGENFSVDKIWLFNVDDYMGVLTAGVQSSPSGFTVAYTARDEFNQTAGTLTGKVAPVGGTWAAGAAGASTAEDGDADDFNASGTPNFNVTRNPALADSSISNGRYELLGGSSTISAAQIQLDVTPPSLTDLGTEFWRGGILARFVDTDNWLMCVLCKGGIVSGSNLRIRLIKRVAGTLTTLATADVTGSGSSATTVRLVLDAVGNYTAFATPVGSALGNALITGQDTTSLQTGQALDDGKVGIYDGILVAAGFARTYDNLAVWVPTPDAVVFASRTAQLTTDGHYRLDSGGTAYGPVSTQAGDLPRLPVAGLEGRTTEVLIKESRGDFDQLPDAGIDDCSAQIFYRPCWLHVPST